MSRGRGRRAGGSTGAQLTDREKDILATARLDLEGLRPSCCGGEVTLAEAGALLGSGTSNCTSSTLRSLATGLDVAARADAASVQTAKVSSGWAIALAVVVSVVLLSVITVLLVTSCRPRRSSGAR